MRYLLAFDSFKDSMSSVAAAKAFAAGVKSVNSQAKFDIVSMSDGGEGFVESLVYPKGHIVRKSVKGPLGKPVKASYGLMPGKKAVIEMAQASGLELVPPKQRNPLKTGTYGTGELIKHALSKGCKTIYVGIGGSATVELGIGMAQALGVKFYDAKGKLLSKPLTGNDLEEIASLDASAAQAAFKGVSIIVACDVTNPLVGPKGAAAVFGPQKGANAAMVRRLEAGLSNVADVIKSELGVSLKRRKGAGAAGGIGAMLHALLGAELRPGIDIVMEANQLAKHAAKADIIVTGEGRIDHQSAGGKTISGIATLGKSLNKPVLAIGGGVQTTGLAPLYKQGITATLDLVNAPMPLEDAIANAPTLMRATGERVARMQELFR